MNRIKLPFGLHHIHQIGCITVYTGRIAFKSLLGNSVPEGVTQEISPRGRIVLSYETTSETLSKIHTQRLGVLCKTVAQHKLNEKYNWTSL